MGDTLTIDEIKSCYDSEWVLLDDPKFSNAHEVVGGTVLFHSRNRDEVYRKIAELDVKQYAVIYTGTIPEEMEFVL